MKLSIYMQSIYDKVHGKHEFRDSGKIGWIPENRNIYFVRGIFLFQKIVTDFYPFFWNCVGCADIRGWIIPEINENV